MELEQPLQTLMHVDHSRLDALLHLALRSSDDLEPFRVLRTCLTRHVAIEEEILFPLIRVDFARSGLIDELVEDHARIASLLAQPPSPDLLSALQVVLIPHGLKEHAVEGVYAHYDRLAIAQRDELVQRIWAFREQAPLDEEAPTCASAPVTPSDAEADAAGRSAPPRE